MPVLIPPSAGARQVTFLQVSGRKGSSRFRAGSAAGAIYRHTKCFYTCGSAYEPMRNIIAGVVLIGIGLAMGESIFLGNFGMLSLFFDGLGFFWVGKGILQLWHQRQPQQ
jgi:hypothetical protein